MRGAGNVRENPSIRINARGAEAEFIVCPVTDPAQVLSVLELSSQVRVKKYYSKLDVAVLARAR
jgi:hypothetical protein